MQIKLYGLIGYPLGHSFSKTYFQEKFLREGLTNYSFQNIEIQNLQPFIENKELLSSMQGFCVTMPYKESIIPYLNEIDPCAKEIGAVNVVRIDKKGDNIYLKGYNTDAFGFEKSLLENLENKNIRALILGSGGASKAVGFALRKHNIEYKIVSRQKKEGKEYISYSELLPSIINSHKLIINTTPLGMKPYLSYIPEIDINQITKEHIIFDLIYNPKETLLILNAQRLGAKTINGFDMLCYQAEKAWRIWNAR
jgi:shikimate dehydrogenase